MKNRTQESWPGDESNTDNPFDVTMDQDQRDINGRLTFKFRIILTDCTSVLVDIKGFDEQHAVRIAHSDFPNALYIEKQ